MVVAVAAVHMAVLNREELSRRMLDGDVDLALMGRGPEGATQSTAGEEVLHFERPGGWHCVTNFGAEPVELPDGELLVASAPLVDGRLGADATAWIRVTD